MIVIWNARSPAAFLRRGFLDSGVIFGCGGSQLPIPTLARGSDLTSLVARRVPLSHERIQILSGAPKGLDDHQTPEAVSGGLSHGSAPLLDWSGLLRRSRPNDHGRVDGREHDAWTSASGGMRAEEKAEGIPAHGHDALRLTKGGDRDQAASRSPETGLRLSKRSA